MTSSNLIKMNKMTRNAYFYFRQVYLFSLQDSYAYFHNRQDAEDHVTAKKSSFWKGDYSKISSSPPWAMENGVEESMKEKKETTTTEAK